MYTAAFSIYIILSSVFSLLMTYVINFFVDRSIKKEKQKAGATAGGVIRGRVYTPKEEETEPAKPEQKKRKDDKFAHEDGGDFLSGKADKKHYRGRVK
jgi:membrane protein insertase Oxa1/YidC/SpoIIIJ